MDDSDLGQNLHYEQKKALIELCKYLCNKYNIEIIKGHKELNQTDCPGINLPFR